MADFLRTGTTRPIDKLLWDAALNAEHHRFLTKLRAERLDVLHAVNGLYDSYLKAERPSDEAWRAALQRMHGADPGPFRSRILDPTHAILTQ